MKIFENYAKDTKDGGFEKYCKNLLEHMGYECKLTPSTGDNGIDIIASKDGVNFGIQCKNWDNTVDSGTVRQLTGSAPLCNCDESKLFTTNRFTKNAQKTADRLGVDLWNWDRISAEAAKIDDLDISVEPTPEFPEKSPLFQHNESVYNKVETFLNKDNKAMVVIGTGMGKTTTALEYCFRHKCRALVLCPKNIIKEDWEANKCVDAMTYQTFTSQYKDIDYNKYGVIICDEVHHTGATTWGAGVKYIIDKGIKVIGLTATKDRLDGVDVAKQLFGDNLCIGYDVLGGINAGILHPFTYVGAYYDSANVCQAIRDKYGEKLDERLAGELDIALNNTPCVQEIITSNMPEGKRKGIIFVEDIGDMNEGIALVKSVYPKTEYRCLHSDMNDDELAENKKWFENTEEGYLCAINMVSEGVHYKNINTLFMLRRTKSSIIFEQQIGRVVTLATKANPNAIVYDLVNNSKTVQDFKIKIKESSDGSSKGSKGRAVPDISGRRVVGGESEFNTDGDKSKQIIIKEYTSSIDKVLEEIKRECDGCKVWTKEELDIIKKWYPSKGKYIFELLPGRHINAIYRMAEKLGVKAETLHPFTTEETNIITKYYPIEGSDCYTRLKNRTRQVVRDYARKLGLVAPRNWVQEEIDIVVKFYPIEGKDCYKRLQHRTADQVWSKAHELGLALPEIWTADNIKLLKQYYPTEGAKCYKHLNDVTDNMCRTMAKKLELNGPDVHWTTEEEEVIKKYYPTETKEVSKRLPGRSEAACVAHASLLGITGEQVWNLEEINILKKFAPIEGLDVYKRFNNRSKSAVTHKIRNLKIDIPSNHWTKEEINFLLENYPKYGVTCFANELLSAHPEVACKVKARKLKLHAPEKEKIQKEPKITKWKVIPWNTEDDDILREYYESEGKEAFKRLSVQRSEAACVARCKKLGLHSRSNLHLKNNSQKKSIICVELNKIFESLSDASKEVSISISGISGVLTGRQETAGGYHWKYVNEEETENNNNEVKEENESC